MAIKKTKAELAAIAEEMGVEVPNKATVAQIEALIEEKKAESAASAADAGEETRVSGSKTVKCDGYEALNVRAEPSFAAKVVKTVKNGAEIEVFGIVDGWAEVDGGFCVADYLV